MMLAEIAYLNFKIDRVFFSRDEIIQSICTFLADNLNAPKHLDAQAVIEAIQIQQGILIERALGVFSFYHLTFQEFLTSQYIVDNSLIETLLEENLINKRWFEVFQLVAGLVRGSADQLLLSMEAKAQEVLRTERLKSLITWAEKITSNSQRRYKPAVRRAIALILQQEIQYNYNLNHKNPKLALTFELISYRAFLVGSNLERKEDILENFRTLLYERDNFCGTEFERQLSIAYEFSRSNLLAENARIHNLTHTLEEMVNKSTIPNRLTARIHQAWSNTFYLEEDWFSLSTEEVKL